MDSNEAEKDYFVSYEELEIHRLMLEDIPRTETYRKAIFDNEAYFKDKVVMDVGCGTGILSLFCAQAGAKKVYAVEASNLANIAKEVVLENNFKDVIEVLHSRVENVTLLNDTKVDIIISEWMGFYLLHEGMLNSVLEARDRFLKDDGEMFPNQATIHVAPCSVPSYNEKWSNFCGVSLNSFAKHLRETKSKKPEIMQVFPDDLLAPAVVLASIDLKIDKIPDLEAFRITHVIGTSKDGNFQGVCIWFECSFPQLTDKEEVTLSTHPSSSLTHWKQTVIFLPESIEVEKEEPIAYKLDMVKDGNHRRYKLELTLLDPSEVEHPMGCSCYQTKCILVRAVLAEQSVIMEEDIVSDEDSD